MFPEYELEQSRQVIKGILDKNVILRASAIALGIYDKAVIYLPELLWIISSDVRGKEILKELGVDDISKLSNGK